MTSEDRKWIESRFDGLYSQIGALQIEVAKLKVKSGVWGVIGGSIPVLIAIGLLVFRSSL